MTHGLILKKIINLERYNKGKITKIALKNEDITKYPCKMFIYKNDPITSSHEHIQIV